MGITALDHNGVQKEVDTDLWREVTWSARAITSATSRDVVVGINQKVILRSTQCSVHLSRADMKNILWLFDVNCTGTPHRVKVKAVASPAPGKTARLDSLDIQVACDCEWWVFGGCEYHAVLNQYLFQRPRGPATPPTIRDPNRNNFVCKHVYASLKRAGGFFVKGPELPKASPIKKIPEKKVQKPAPTPAPVDAPEVAEEQALEEKLPPKVRQRPTRQERTRPKSPEEFQKQKMDEKAQKPEEETVPTPKEK